MRDNQILRYWLPLERCHKVTLHFQITNSFGKYQRFSFDAKLTVLVSGFLFSFTRLDIQHSSSILCSIKGYSKMQ